MSDTGVGVPEAEREHVFERLYRGHQARQMRPSGTGLGLAIACWIADAHGGSIGLARHEGPGTTVSISLPASAVR